MALLNYTIGFFDILDIVIVAVIIYRIIILLNAKIATRVVVGTGGAFLLFVASQLAELPTLHWILDNFLSSILLVVFIIFQSDIRRALLVFRSSSSSRGKETEGVSELLNELLSAVEFLSSRTIGALIVIERAIPVDSFIEVGTEIDAKVTAELITSIFLPYSPIHDGAVIIQQGKLTKAGCLLPLSRNPDIDKAYGTRHRAALGLAELVDAAVVVVSEERGSVSLVLGGKITTNLDSAALRKVLRPLLEQGA